MISRKSFWLGTLAVVVAGLVAGVAIGDRLVHQPHHYAEAAWAEVFSSTAGLAHGVDTIVLAQALDTRPGRVAYSDNGEDTLPFQVTELEVIRPMKGAREYDHIFVERAGGIDPEGQQVILDADGGPFEQGRIYLLFLKRQPGSNYFYQVNDQGRYTARGAHFLAVNPDDPVATTLHGQTVEQAVARVEAALRTSAPRGPLAK